MVKKILIVFGLIFFFSTASFAAQEQNLPTQIQDSFEQKIVKYYPKIQTVSRNLLLSLAVIQLVLSVGFMAMRQELEIGGIFAQLVKTILIVGFFLFILESPQYLKSIYQGFDKLGMQAGNVSFDQIINRIYDMWSKIFDKASVWQPGSTLAYVIVGAIASAALIFLIGQALMIYAFTIFSIYIGMFWIAFGSFDQTRPWAIHAITNVIRWSAKWMVILILMSITFSLVDDALAHGADDTTSIITLLIVSLMMVSISSGLSSFVDSYFSGMGGGDNNRGMQMLSAAGGAAIGAVAGTAAGKTIANDAVKAARASSPDGSAGFKDYAKAAGKMAHSAFSGSYDGGQKGMFGALAQPPGFGKTDTGSSNSSMRAGSSSTKEVPLGTDSGFGGVDGTIGNAMTEPKPNPNVVS